MEKLASSEKVSPRIFDESEPKKVEDIKMALTGKASAAVLQRKILNDIRRIIQRCDEKGYPNCVLGLSEDGYREIRWPGVRVIVDATENGEVFGKCFTRWKLTPVFLTGCDVEFERLITAIGVYVLFKISRPVDIVPKDVGRRTPRDFQYGVTLPIKLEKHIGCDSPENFPFHFDFEEDMSRTV